MVVIDSTSSASSSVSGLPKRVEPTAAVAAAATAAEPMAAPEFRSIDLEVGSLVSTSADLATVLSASESKDLEMDFSIEALPTLSGVAAAAPVSIDFEIVADSDSGD